MKTEILGYTLKMTCGACPEQYDVLDAAGNQMGYLRLRHGYFRADYGDCGGETVYESSPKGDGIFYDDEREYYLTKAVVALHERHTGSGFTQECPNCGHKFCIEEDDHLN